MKQMKQNLIKSICPDCGKRVKNIIGWVNVVNKEAVPANLPEELCPSCMLDKINADFPCIVL